MKQQKTKKAISREMREKIDNKVVLATAIALVAAMVLLFLMNWSQSAYAVQTITIIEVLQWIFVAGIVAFLVLYFVKKEKKFLFGIPYCAAGTIFMMEILKGTISTFALKILSKIPFLKMAGGYATTAQRFSTLFIFLAIYLVASYIYYGVKIKKLSK